MPPLSYQMSPLCTKSIREIRKNIFCVFEPADCLLRVANSACRRVTLYSVKSCHSHWSVFVCGLQSCLLSTFKFHSMFPDKSISLNC